MGDDFVLSSPLDPSACEKNAKILQFLEEITRIVDDVQQSVLNEILIRNSQIKYLNDRLTFKSNIWIVTYKDLHVKIQDTKYDPNPFSNHFFNSHFPITSKQIKESAVNEYLVVYVFHGQSRSSMKSGEFTSKSLSII
ncbi:hypothetical protein R3W88_014892 [Solanum pinnatisectum]|uniref:Uncharacterized protein n=1 Tax=Solanum pinnatisectum TaxID=50273 RepID=A0AAV9KVD4_9SOLN|nr:hypothetical protein R3W88_014892 [Solanum pinnatisectum]